MNLYIGSDHRGFPLKEQLRLWLVSLGHKVVDCGNTVPDPDDDYPDYAFAVADKVTADPGSRGIVICGSGGGVTIAANKVRGIRCVLGENPGDVIHNRDHNDSNVLALSADYTSVEQAKELIRPFLSTAFAGEPGMLRRLAKISARESSS